MKTSLTVAIALCFLYTMLLESGLVPVRAHMKLQSQWQSNQYVVEKYVRDSYADVGGREVVFVGSSLTQRLSFSERASCVYNLSLSGDSALTGLGVIANATRKPKVVFVEINEPERSRNDVLIKKTSDQLSQVSPIFYVENKPVNLIIRLLPRTEKVEPSQEMNDTVRLSALALQMSVYKTQIPLDLLNKQMTEFRRIVDDLESKGIKVIFFEMPIHPDLEESPRAVQIRNAFKHQFYKNQLIGFRDLAKGRVIKTVDGVHLAVDEAKTVVKNVNEYADNICLVSSRTVSRLNNAGLPTQ